MNETLLRICQQCPERRAARSSRCPADSVAITDHATGGACPLGRYHADAQVAMESKVELHEVSIRRPGTAAAVNPPTHTPRPVLPLPRDQWPLAARTIATLANDTDAGVGSTLERLLGTAGVAIKALADALNVSCGCSGRRDRLNATYPY